MPSWLKNAVFYEVYPQSFQDSNGDGIGDIPGIIRRLDYIRDLGCNALWINPCFESPFFDAGYDVTDYYAVAKRYGTNEDLKHLFDQAHKRGMHVLLDLVPGHTSLRNRWFRQSCLDERNEFSDTYIWKPMPRDGRNYAGIAGFETGLAQRPGGFAVNCFSTQPALNYGFAKVTEPWQFSYDSEQAEHTRLLMQDIMDFWLSMGCDGFRMDMAHSLVKEDEGWRCTSLLWQKMRAFLDQHYPQAAIISEWGDPAVALKAGFHMDFLLHFGPSHYMDLFREKPYFAAGSGGSFKAFAAVYTGILDSIQGTDGYVCIPSGNHDMVRMRHTLSEDEMKLAFAFLLTMPGCPFIYYGDEIGMPYITGLKSKEGGYERTGSRTPMQWNSHANAGFSTASPARLYLPLQEREGRTTVEKEAADPESLLNTIRRLNTVRRDHEALQADGAISFLQVPEGQEPLYYERSCDGEVIRVVINPSGEEGVASISPAQAGQANSRAHLREEIMEPILSCHGEAVSRNGHLSVPGQSFTVFSVKKL